ncbi:Alpha-2-macroglobulin receptor-associated protein [Trichinella pseudospiralis]|uniref:Alpha-2-macroglobulin receptor-associated protein n=1 Tax=Trichinella pseudospiralis TaxID=6337 RepID=A0A0V0Y2I9_TRIPS|nr:Alpha-2-macroglobulin receptor-associated protein [Trichinella pseudospiralis]
MLYIFLFGFLLPILASKENKYSRQLNEVTANPSESALRSRKLNLIWQKLKRAYSADQLEPLLDEILALDAEYMDIKNNQKIAKDIASVEKRELDLKLLRFLQEHGTSAELRILANELKKDVEKANNYIPVVEKGRGVAARFVDKKLNKLWNRVALLSLSGQELQNLEDAFRKQDALSQEYNALAANVAERKRHPSDSSSVEEYENKLAELKEKLKALQNGFQLISKTVEDAELRAQDQDFSEPSVIELWNRVQRSSLSTDRQELLKQELQQLEVQIRKLNFFEQDKENSKIKFGKVGKENLLSAEYKEKSRKLEDLRRRLDKFEKYILNQIRSEL